MDASRTLPACADWPVPVGSGDMSVWQSGRCAFCGYDDSRLVRDHDHATGLIRGLLCRECNNAEAFRDSPAWALYRDGVNPAGILASQEVYEPLTLTVLERAKIRRRDADPAWQRELEWASL